MTHTEREARELFDTLDASTGRVLGRETAMSILLAALTRAEARGRAEGMREAAEIAPAQRTKQMDKIDTSKEAVAKRLERLESLAERGWIDGDVVDLVSALTADLEAARAENVRLRDALDYERDRAEREIRQAAERFHHEHAVIMAQLEQSQKIAADWLAMQPVPSIILRKRDGPLPPPPTEPTK